MRGVNRRGFFGLIAKAVAVAVAIGVSPKLLAPVTKAVKEVSIGPGVTSAGFVWVPEMVSFNGGACATSYRGSDGKTRTKIIPTRAGEFVTVRVEEG